MWNYKSQHALTATGHKVNSTDTFVSMISDNCRERGSPVVRQSINQIYLSKIDDIIIKRRGSAVDKLQIPASPDSPLMLGVVVLHALVDVL